MTDITVPVLIVGGGGCGLSASIFLSRLGIDHCLVERHLDTSPLPKAHYLNQRTMEIFRQHGVAESVYRVGTPLENMKYVRWATSLGGDGPLDRRTLANLEAYGGGELNSKYAADSPCPPCNYPQNRLEPLLRERAEQSPHASLRFHTELISFTQDRDSVQATVMDLDSEHTYTVRADYLIAADGGKTLGPALGVSMVGPSGLLDMVSAHFSADLSAWVDEDVLITWLLNPEGAGSFGSGVMAAMGPTWGKHSEEWAFHFTFAPDDPERFDEQAIVPRLRELLKLPELDINVHRVSHWILEGVLAEKYHVGRIFLAGDAAHRHPPTTGLGLNTAIQDAHNLAWKLAAVLGGDAGPELLATYQAERQPVGMRNVDWAMFTFLNHLVLDAGIGLMPGQSHEARVQTFQTYFDTSPMGDTRRARAAEIFATQRTEYQAHDLEIGFHYASGALVPDGTDPPPVDPMGRLYHPTTRPGHRLPHAWLTDGANRVSTHDLVADAVGFVLLIGSAGQAWVDAAAAAQEKLGVPVRAITIDPDTGLCDIDGTWRTQREVWDSGAVLVRPDNHVAWRSHGSVIDPAGELTQAVAAVLAVT